jgi:hypothetical protein
MTRQLYVAFFLVSCYWLIRFRQGVIVKIQGSVKKKYVCERKLHHTFPKTLDKRRQVDEAWTSFNMKCVITGMPEKMSMKEKESRRGMDMK